MDETKSNKRRFLVSFSFSTTNGFGFGNWAVTTEGTLIDLANAREFGEKICKDKCYESIVIMAISEVEQPNNQLSRCLTVGKFWIK